MTIVVSIDGRFTTDNEHKPSRRRFQRGSVQKRKSGPRWVWIGFWRDQTGRRRARTLGSCRDMSRHEAEGELANDLLPLNVRLTSLRKKDWTLKMFIEECYFPFGRRHWKHSTAETTEDRIRFHLISDLGSDRLCSFGRERLQVYLDGKTQSGLSFSTVSHLRWDLRAIFRLALQDGILALSPAEALFVGGKPGGGRTVLTAEQVQSILDALELREQTIVRLAVFSGMRPGEILALQWKHLLGDHLSVEQRTYKGRLDSPKTSRSIRLVALSPQTSLAIEQWRQAQTETTDAEAWVFPSENPKTPLRRDNVWRRVLSPALKPMGLEWATFQIMRRTHATLSRRVGIDPKVVADQLGHGLGVNLNVYTVAALDQRLKAVHMLEQSLVPTRIN
jgi:integrase